MQIVSPTLKIVQYPHPSLRHPAVPLTGITEKVRSLAAAMLDLMYEHHGLGLAAPQVGMPYQMFVANYGADREKPELEGVYINPVILDKHGGFIEGEEGCLSFPGLYRKVRRARNVVVQAYDLRGQLIELKLSEMPARIWQHETDHLHGTLFIDKLGAIAKLGIRGSLGEFEREYRKAQKRGEIPPDAEIEQQLKDLEKLA
jgi:peptide deformylase